MTDEKLDRISSTDSSDGTLKPSQTDNENDVTYNASDGYCFICHKPINIYAIGECNHPTCYVCSARLRVLCGDMTCPVCKTYLPKVMFTHARLPFEQLEAKRWRDYSYNQQYNIGFCGKNIEREFFCLSEHGCPKCDVLPFTNFVQLEKHLYHRHKLFFCDICVRYVKTFTQNRLFYTSSNLKLHCSEGESASGEPCGHPFCKFCRKRFLDKEELYKHMKCIHYYCHFCENGNLFYFSYSELEKHFRKHHFVCQIGVCANRQYINAFRSEVEYSWHLAREHADELYQYVPSPSEFPGDTTIDEHHDTCGEISEEVNDSLSTVGSLADENADETLAFNLKNEKDFPLLSNVSLSIQSSRHLQQPEIQNKKKLVVEAFPALENNYRNRNVVTAAFLCAPSSGTIPADNNEITEPANDKYLKSTGLGVSLFSTSATDFPPLPKHFSSEESVNQIRSMSSHQQKTSFTAHKYIPTKECFPDYPPWRNKKNASTQVCHEDILHEVSGLPIFNIPFKFVCDDLWHMDKVRKDVECPENTTTKILNFSESDFPCLSTRK
ncbi:E3 ubiquitin-protein ligase HEL2-like [Teleopsis dalmanni]|uniref:E3 ubiquitin-protein ligase HEL2-like n=1 Tax=Teleopsis dalmanni TaxID=139649 RepID=UPI0018CCCEDB|nr:E3 ubiquitin-protein ligase HEL2-like [Teleopsis dalmanni]